MKLSSTRWEKTQDWRALRATRDTCSEFGSFATSPSGAFGGQMLQRFRRSALPLRSLTPVHWIVQPGTENTHVKLDS